MNKLTYLVLLLFAGTLFVQESSAIPAFARKYRLSCKTCHAPSAPKLKEYGESFAGQGFKLEDEESPRYYVPVGDEKLSLIRDFPIAVRLDGHVTYNSSNNESSDFGTPYLMKLLSGGELSNKLSYYFYFYLSEYGEVAGVEDAYLMYDNLADTELDIMIGQFQVSDPLYKRELRLSLEDYVLYTSRIGLSDITLKYDRGIILTYGFKTSTDIVFEIVNGNGIPERELNLFDKDKYKSYFGKVSQGIGDYITVGIFAYLGKEVQESTSGDELDNEVLIYGPNLTFNYNDFFEVNFQYTNREDSEVFPFEAATTADVVNNIRTEGILAEVIYSPKADQSDWYLLGMYNKVQSDFNLADYESVTLHAGYMLRRNVRLAAEYSYVLNDPQFGEDFGKFSIGVVSAF